MRGRPVGWLSVVGCLVLISPGVAVGQASRVTAAAATPNAVTVWNANAGDAAIAGCMGPLSDPFRESRLYAVMHIAVHDSTMTIQRRFGPYVPGLQTEDRVAGGGGGRRRPRRARPVGHPACVPELPGVQLGRVEADYTAALGAIPDGLAKTQGVAVGQAAAAQILARRSGDGSTPEYLDSSLPQGVQPGQYRYTAPYNFVVAPGWARVPPFVLRDSAQYRPVPPYLVTGKNYAADLNEVKRLGGDGTTTPSTRTPDQTEIALFWVGTPPSQWNRGPHRRRHGRT